MGSNAKLRKGFGGKSIILTGAAGGLGSAMARLLAPHWDSALLLDVNEAGVQALARELDSSGTRVVARQVDLTSAESIEKATRDLPARLATPDVLINNAGVTKMKLAEQLPLDDYRWIMEVNYFAVVAMVSRFLPSMLERRSGQLVTIASGSGVLANYGGAGYCASKFAVVGYMEALRQELAGTGVRTSCVLLPTVMTDFHRVGVLGGEFGEMAKKLPTLTPEDAAERLLAQAARGAEVISFGAGMEATLLLNRLSPAALRRVMSVNGYFENRRRGRV